MKDEVIIDGEVYVKKSNQKVDEYTQKLIESAKVIYKTGGCLGVKCFECPFDHSKFATESDYDILAAVGTFSSARRRVAARWLIEHGVTEIDGKPVVIEPPKETAPQKEDIREYCKRNRFWAAMDKDGEWYIYTSKPTQGYRLWLVGTTRTVYNSVNGEYTFPSVPWDKSLIAPDGSMPLLEAKEKKEKKKPEVGKWYRAKGSRPKGEIGKLVEVDSFCLLLYFPNWSGGHNNEGLGKNKYTGNHCCWMSEEDIEEVPAPKEKKWKPKRGDPIFVWDDDCSPDVPCPMLHFYSKTSDGKVRVLEPGHPNIPSPDTWDHMRRFDPALVELPRKDWPPEEE